MTARPGASAVAVLAVLAAGCGSGGGQAAQQSVNTHTTDATVTSARSDLIRSVRQAIVENDRVSGHVLWTNVVPAAASRSTGGPALSELRAAAATRRKQGIRIRTASEHRQIISIALDPSYARATAVVRARERLVPYRGTERLGRAINLDERATVHLRRVGSSNHFRVWSVAVGK
jgi:hypothetical protein